MANGKQILVLDQDPSMHALVSLWLTDAGYDLRESGMPYSSRLENGGSIRLIIADLNSPKTVAEETLSGLRARFPAAYIIATSGYFQAGAGTESEMARQLGVARVLAKPFSCGQLVAAVDELFRDVRAE